MVMTQESADKIAYLICLGAILNYCEAKGITENTANTELLKSEVVEDFVKNFFVGFIRTEKQEAIEFTKFVFNDVVASITKWKQVADEESTRIGQPLSGKTRARTTINLGPEVGIEINREIVKRRIGFTYGKI